MLLEILGLLPISDLRAVCLVSQKLRILGEPFLYSEIHLTWTLNQTPPIVQFLRTVLMRPQLASYVRSINLDGPLHHNRSLRSTISDTAPAEHEISESIAFIRSVGVPFSDLWEQELRNGEMDACLAALLSQLAELRTLQIGPNFAKGARSWA